MPKSIGLSVSNTLLECFAKKIINTFKVPNVYKFFVFNTFFLFPSYSTSTTLVIAKSCSSKHENLFLDQIKLN